MAATRQYVPRHNRESLWLTILALVAFLLFVLFIAIAHLIAQDRSALVPGGASAQADVGSDAIGPRQEATLVRQFDKDGDGRLNRAERDAARKFLVAAAAASPHHVREDDPGVFRVPFQPPPPPGPKLTPADMKSYPQTPLYDMTTLRTFFLTFEDPDWKSEMADFYRTGVDVPISAARHRLAPSMRAISNL